MVRRHVLLVVSLTLAPLLASAQQPLGTFRWQLEPHCNIVSVTVSQSGGVFRVEGTDDQCGGGDLASAIGTAFLNPDGTAGIGLNIVSTPGGAPVHVDAAINVSTLNGSWRDSAGNSGELTYRTGAGSGGTPRPSTGTIGAIAVNASQVQLRIGGTCSAGSSMVGVNHDGSVACQPSGSITGISTGPGLAGGGTTGSVALDLDLVELANQLHLRERTDAGDLAVGDAALQAVSADRYGNSAFGNSALQAATTGDSNTAVGFFTLRNTTTGNNNTAVGASALHENVDGFGSTAIGFNALTQTKGYQNTAVGYYAGHGLKSGAFNVYIANYGVVETENNTMRIGGAEQTRTFVAGVRGVATGVSNAVPVVVDGAGQLGTISSSIRGKEHVADLGEIATRLQQLRPVRFQYRVPFADGSTPVQYGLIAEEVATVLPELVAYGADAQPETVMYHVLPTLLVAEVQRLTREIEALRERLDRVEGKRE